jgi:hypothetical protein
MDADTGAQISLRASASDVRWLVAPSWTPSNRELGSAAMTTGFVLTVVVVLSIVLYRIVWFNARERRRQYPKRVK